MSAREVVPAHLDRIERVNPGVNAIVTLVADRALDGRRGRRADGGGGERVGPLHGLPVAHKDLHDTAGIRTTTDRRLRDSIPDQDNLIVERLAGGGGDHHRQDQRARVRPRFAHLQPVFGATRNPYDLDRSAGGSSGGAGAALACGMLPIADGSDMGGSLRNPASFNNVVGLRPSPGRVPTWPAVDAVEPRSS